MQESTENTNELDNELTAAAPEQETADDASEEQGPQTIPLGPDGGKQPIKRNKLKKDFKEKGEALDAQKPPMTKEETLKHYEDNIPFMKLQDEFEELIYRFEERKIKNLELQVRQVEAVGYLSQWKAGQDDAKRRKEKEDKMREEWEKMSPEEKEEYKKKAQANLKIMEAQAKGSIVYTGENGADIMSFIDGEVRNEPIISEAEDKRISIQVPGPNGFIELTLIPGQSLARAENGEFVIMVGQETPVTE